MTSFVWISGGIGLFELSGAEYVGFSCTNPSVFVRIDRLSGLSGARIKRSRLYFFWQSTAGPYQEYIPYNEEPFLDQLDKCRFVLFVVLVHVSCMVRIFDPSASCADPCRLWTSSVLLYFEQGNPKLLTPDFAAQSQCNLKQSWYVTKLSFEGVFKYQWIGFLNEPKSACWGYYVSKIG